MRRLGRAGGINDVNYPVFNCYRFVYRFAFNYAFNRSRPQELNYFSKPLDNQGVLCYNYNRNEVKIYGNKLFVRIHSKSS